MISRTFSAVFVAAVLIACSSAPIDAGSTAKTPSCVSASDCAEGERCDSMTSTCSAQIGAGASCSLDDVCLSGHCVDGVCCDKACDGQCEACDLPSSLGTCSPVLAGAPHGKRPACAGPTDDNVCTGKACNGTKSVTECVGLVGPEIRCGASACEGEESTSNGCDSDGSCDLTRVISSSCAPYACGATACKSECESSTDCARGAFCDSRTKTCLVPGCDSAGKLLINEDGTETDCAPYRCTEGACQPACSSIADCIETYVCNASAQCVSP